MSATTLPGTPRNAVPGAFLRRLRGADSTATPVPVRDWMWHDYRFVVVSGPFTGLSATTLRAGLRAQHALGTSAHCLDRLDRGARRWVPVPVTDLRDHLDRVVTQAAATDDPVVPAQLAERMLAAEPDDLPVRVLVVGEYLAMRFDHVLGDGSVARQAVPWLESLALGLEPAVVPGSSGDRTAFRTAVRHKLGGHGVPWRPLLATAALIRRARADQNGTRFTTPEGFVPRPSVEIGHIDAEAAARLRDWRKVHAPGLSNAMLLAAATWGVARRHGLVPADVTPGIGVDLRAYLPRRTEVDGNFTTCVTLPAGTPCDPVAVRDAVEAAVAGAVPLLAAGAQHGMAQLRARLPRRSTGATQGYHHAPSLVLNFLGRMRWYDTRPWVQGRPHTQFAAPSVDGSRALTVNTTELADGFHCAFSFHDSVLPRSSVRAAVEELERCPAAVLEGLRTGS